MSASPTRTGRTQISLLFAAIALVLLLFSGCSSGSNEKNIGEAEPGRVNIRQQHLFPGDLYVDSNFSAILPEGWSAVDTLGYELVRFEGPPTGILARFGEPKGQILYSLTPPDTESPYGALPGTVRKDSVIDGVTVDWIVPVDPVSKRENLHIKATFPSLPGDPQSGFGLSIQASGLSLAKYHEAIQILESIRHAPPPEPFERPVPKVTPGPDWQRIPAGPETPLFSVLVPPNTEFTTALGYGSFIAMFTVNGIEIHFEYRSAFARPASPDGHIRYSDSARQQYWVEVIDGKLLGFFRPFEESPSGESFTGTSTARIPGLPDLVMPEGAYSSELFNCGGAFWVKDVDRDQQELVLAILRTIEVEQTLPGCNR